MDTRRRGDAGRARDHSPLVKPRTRITFLLIAYLFAAAVVSFIFGVAVDELGGTESVRVGWLRLVFSPIAAAGAAALGLVFATLGSGSLRGQGRLVGKAVLLTLPYNVAQCARFPIYAQAPFPEGIPHIGVLVGIGFSIVSNFVFVSGMVVGALAFSKLKPNEQRSMGVLFGAMMLNLFLDNGAELLRGLIDIERAIFTLRTVYALFLFTALWLVATRGPGSRIARNLAILTPAITLTGLLIGATLGAATETTALVNGLGAILSVLLLVYGALRLGLPGLDLKVRFAVSKSTIAAIFIAVFFVASEVAQQFFSEKTSSTYIGIGIAGTLVFAMAPIQRAAERLAEKAVPATPSTSVQAGTVAENAYRRAVRLAMRDRDLSAKEERELVLLAHDLGLTPAQAFAIRDVVTQEAA